MNSFPYPIYYLGLLIITVLLARFIFRRYISFAKRYNFIKLSNARASHKGLVFTGGGVVYAAVIMVAAVVLDNLDFVGFAALSPVIGTSILIAVLGFYDDFTDIAAFQKYIILTFLISMLVYSFYVSGSGFDVISSLNGFLGIHELSPISSFIFTCFVYLSIMNAINLTDGIDGYLGIFSISFFLSFLFTNHLNGFYTLSSISVIIIASSAIFLRYNFSKKGKKLFVGDAGSLLIGFWMAYFLIHYISTANNANAVDVFSINLENIPVIAISIISIPVLDTLRVMLVRVLNKKSPFSADRNHLHHILLDSGMSHLRTSVFLTVANWCNCVLIFLLEPNFNSNELTLIYIAISLGWYVFFEYMKRKNISS